MECSLCITFIWYNNYFFANRKFICLNSNLDPKSKSNDLIHALVQDTYESLFPLPSNFELPLNYRNRFLYMEELVAWRKWRDFVRALIYACLASLVFLTLVNFFSAEVSCHQGSSAEYVVSAVKVLDVLWGNGNCWLISWLGLPALNLLAQIQSLPETVGSHLIELCIFMFLPQTFHQWTYCWYGCFHNKLFSKQVNFSLMDLLAIVVFIVKFYDIVYWIIASVFYLFMF